MAQPPSVAGIQVTALSAEGGGATRSSQNLRNHALCPHVHLAAGEFFLIDLNKATPEELRLLPFVSDSMAEEIIRYRTEKGGFAGRGPFGFKSIDELSEIKGIGPARLKKMRKYLREII